MSNSTRGRISIPPFPVRPKTTPASSNRTRPVSQPRICSNETEGFIYRYFTPEGAGPTQDDPPDTVISRRINKLAARSFNHLAERKPALEAIESWGSWLSVKTNPLVARARSAPRPSSTPGLILETKESQEPEPFDLTTVKRKKKGRRFKEKSFGLANRKPIHSASACSIGPGNYFREILPGETGGWRNDIKSNRTQQLLSEWRCVTPCSFGQQRRWPKVTQIGKNPDPGTYFPTCDDEQFVVDTTTASGYRKLRGYKFGPQPIPGSPTKYGRNSEEVVNSGRVDMGLPRKKVT